MRYLVNRVLYHGSLFAGILLATFFLFQIMPSDPARIILGSNASEAQVEALRRELGLDRPLRDRLGDYLSRAGRLEFGRSFVDGRVVGDEVRQKLLLSTALITLSLGLTCLYLVVILVAEQLGRVRIGGFTDFLFVSTPTMFSGLVVALVAGRYWPVTVFSGRLASADDWIAMIPPAFALAFYPMAILSRILRAQLDSLQSAPFILSARAQGFGEARILWTFMLKNAIVPVLATLATMLPTLFTGAFIIEVIFSIPATGTLLVKSVLQRDLPMLQGLVAGSGLVVVACHLAVEAVYPVLDPRMVRHA